MNNSMDLPESHRILIVEDEEGLAIHLNFLLKRNNYLPLDAVAYGEEAVQRACELKPDLVLMDINLAGQMNGIEAARIIHERCGTPIIFLSALAGDMTIRDATASDPFAYLVKPVKEADLRAAIEVTMYKYKMEARLQESEERYRLLFEKTSDGFGLGEIIYDAQGAPRDFRLLAVNPAFGKIFDIDPDKVDGQVLSQAFPGFDGSFLIEKFGQVTLTGQTSEFEYVLEDSNRLLKMTAYSTRPGQFAVTAEDITERRKAEQDLRKSYGLLKQSLDRMTILRNIDQAITEFSDLSSMAGAILSNIVTPGEIDGAVVFVPNQPGAGRVRGTGPLGMLRLAGIAGMPEAIIDSAVLNWQINLAAQCFSTCKPIMVDDLSRDNHPGAQALYQEAGYLTCAALPLQARGQAKGVLQFYNRAEIAARDGGDWKDFLHSLSLQTAIGMDHVEMMENLKRSNRELAMAYDETIKGWAQALELRDQETRGHADRVSDLTVRLAANLGFKGEALDHIRRGALLHDIGKMAIQDRILNKTGPLTSEEWVTMRQHTTIAYNMLYNIEYLRPALDVVYAHHEKWDGTGYPRGLKGEEIPLSARIFAVVDVWDAITNPRPYRNLPWPVSEARAYIIQQSGKHFDPRVVEEFIKLIG